MFACLTKPLDWMAIKLATRCVKICPPLPSGTARPASSLDLNVIGSADQRPAIDIACAADGSFTFASPVKTPAARNNTVYGKLYPISSDWPQRPTVILLHGWNAELCYYRLFPYLAELLGSARINTLTFELPYHMQRRPRQGPVTDFISSDVPAMIEATRQAVAEIRGLCRWISEQGPGGVGLWGFSLGAWLAGLVLRAEEGLKFAVLTTPIARMDRAMAELPFCGPVRHGLKDTKLDLRPLNLDSALPRIPARQILLMESRHDLFAPRETIEQLWDAWKRPDIWRLRHSHISVLMSLPVMKRTVRWMETKAEMLKS